MTRPRSNFGRWGQGTKSLLSASEHSMSMSSSPRAEPSELVVDPPPEVPRPASGHPLARVLPVAMVVAAAGMMALYFTSGHAAGRGPMSGVFPVMMVMSLIGTLAYGARGTQRGAELDRNRRDYLRYLDGIDRAAAGTARRQYEDAHHTHPDPSALWAFAGTERRWERRPGTDHFGDLRVGLGAQPPVVRLVAPPPTTAQDTDPVTARALESLLRDRDVVDGLPLTVRLADQPALTVTGDPDCVRALIRAVVCQLATFHAPEDLTLSVDVAEHDAHEWDWLKWLPHVGNPAAARAVRIVVGADGPSELHVDAGVVTVRSSGATGRADGLTRDEAATCARRLAAHCPAAGREQRRTAPRNWPGLMSIGDPARFDVDAAWGARTPRDHLRVPIGFAEDGAPVWLDLKEAAQQGMGPHGLCVGATGSGKSEFLRTLTLGLIASHPPEELNLVLVDFKGGATFLGLERAAHVSAVITNLADEAHLVARMRDALAGEVHRRQQLLREAGVAGIGDYRRLGRPVPLPALVLVVDEFAELLTAHPDFAELFLAIGRVGRSLGMHLLLASQRLDEGRLRGLDTHLSYRICLKTFSANESRAVLGVADAYQLPAAPGAAYLKTADGAMTRFHAAYVSRPHAVDEAAEPASDAVRLFTARLGPRDGRDPVPPAASGATVLDTVLDRVAGHGTPAHRVWLEPLAGPPTLDTLLSRLPTDRLQPLTVPIGLVDSPFDQRRELMVATLAGQAGNVVVVGGPRAGKSTALCSLVLGLAATHDPRDVQIYALDFGGGTLASTVALPHVGTVAGRHDPDLVRSTVSELESLLRARESGFRSAGVDSVAEYRRRRAAGGSAAEQDPYGEVFLVVDGWSALRTSFDHLEAPITALAAQGLAYGIHVVLAASRWADLRPALKDHLGTRVELRLGDPAESEMDRRRARDLADCPPGRGITRDGRDTTLALPRLDGRQDIADAGEAMRSAAQQLRERYGNRCAPPIAVLPALVRRGDPAARTDAPTRITLGIGERQLSTISVDFAAQPHLIVLGDVECGKTATLRTLCTELVATTTAAQAQMIVVDFRRTLLGVVETDHLAGYAMSASSLAASLSTLGERLTARMPGPDVTQQQLRARSWWSGPELYAVVDDYDLVAEGAGLTPLLSWLPHARDVGLHVVVARRSGGAARAMFDPVLTRLRDLGAMGLMMSAAPEEGVLLGSVRPCALPPGRGTLITRGRPDELVQVAWCDPP